MKHSFSSINPLAHQGNKSRLIDRISKLTSHKKQINKTFRQISSSVLHDDEMLVSYDVKSLFTSIPVNESIDLSPGKPYVGMTWPWPGILYVAQPCTRSSARS